MADNIFRNIPYVGFGSWQQPVAVIGDLPSFGNDVGDIRVVQATFDLYEWNGASWILIGGPGFPSGITSLNGLLAASQFFATGTTGTDFNISSAVATHTFNIPDAGTGARGVVTNVSQTFGGQKSFNDGILLSAGAAATPSLGFIADTNTGLYNSAADQLSATTGGIERLRVDSSGGITITQFTTAGVVHNSAAGLLTSSLVTDSDLANIYLLLAGRSGGQTAHGGTDASNNLVLRSTSNATKGQVYVDETTESTSTTTGALRVGGGVAIGQSLSVGNDFRITNEASFVVQQFTVNTTDATATTLASIAVPSDSCMMIEALVVARRTGGAAGSAGDSAAYIRTTRMKNVAGTLTEHNTQTSFTSEDVAAYNCTFTTSGTNAILQVTGVANTNITWEATVRQYLNDAT